MSRVFVVIGHPVAHSLSPAIHGAAYAELGLDASYELLDAPDEAAVARAVTTLRAGKLAGANVTVPWKRTALALADRADASAADVGAANTLCRDASGAVVAYNTDVGGLAAELAALVAQPERALVLGAGGAALAAVAAARRLGSTRIGVSARRFVGGVPRDAWPQARELGHLGAELLAWPTPEGEELSEFAAGAALVIQATSAGMHGADPGESVARAVPWAKLHPSAVAYDLVYQPAETEFLRAARAAGRIARGGLGMLVGQAALSFELWFGVTPPQAAMQRAAELALAARSRS